MNTTKRYRQTTMPDFTPETYGNQVMTYTQTHDNGWTCNRCSISFPMNTPFGLFDDEIVCGDCMNILNRTNDISNKARAEDVAHQSHYEDNAIQPIEYMRANMSQEEFLAFCMGNVIKYVSRYKRKNGVEDLKKAQVYLGWAIDRMEQ